MDTLEKLKYLIDNEIVNRYTLAKELEMSKTTLTNYYEGNTKPSSLRLGVIEKYINEKFGSDLSSSNAMQAENSINNRIEQLYNRSGERSIRAYAIKLGIAPTTLNECIKGAEPRFSLLNAIINGEPSINVDWLMTGKGDMLKDTSTDIENLKEELAMLKGENRVLREQIGLGEKKESKHRSA